MFSRNVACPCMHMEQTIQCALSMCTQQICTNSINPIINFNEELCSYFQLLCQMLKTNFCYWFDLKLGSVVYRCHLPTPKWKNLNNIFIEEKNREHDTFLLIQFIFKQFTRFSSKYVITRNKNLANRGYLGFGILDFF